MFPETDKFNQHFLLTTRRPESYHALTWHEASTLSDHLVLQPQHPSTGSRCSRSSTLSVEAHFPGHPSIYSLRKYKKNETHLDSVRVLILACCMTLSGSFTLSKSGFLINRVSFDSVWSQRHSAQYAHTHLFLHSLVAILNSYLNKTSSFLFYLGFCKLCNWCCCLQNQITESHRLTQAHSHTG